MQPYFAQYGQDAFVHAVFFNKRSKGFFLDIGAHNGVTYSNSCFFEKSLGWTGICVEPIPDVFAELKKNRQCILENACITATDGEVKFTRITGYSEMLSGITDQYDERHLSRIEKELKEAGGTKEEITVQGKSISTLIKQHNVTQIDFCSIDTEGNEMPILKSFPFHLIKPRVFLIENNYKDQQMRDLLAAQGYTYVFRLGDEIYKLGTVSLFEKWQILLFRLKRKFSK